MRFVPKRFGDGETGENRRLIARLISSIQTQLNLLTVESQFYPARQRFIAIGMFHLMTQVGQQGPTGGQTGRNFNRLRNIEVSRMGSKSQTVDHQNLKIPQTSLRCLRNGAAVGQVSEGTDPKSQGAAAAVMQGKRFHRQAEQLKRAADLSGVQLWPISLLGLFTENITEIFPEGSNRLSGTVNGNRLTRDEVERSQIVDAVDMVGMGVGIENRVDTLDLLPQGLLPQISGGIDENVSAPIGDQDAATGP
jgi:hypothetical protein